MVSYNQARVATTGAAGFALQNGTPNLLTWTAPGDSTMMVRVQTVYLQHTTSLETGGAIGLTFTEPDGTTVTHSISAGGLAAGTTGGTSYDIFVQGGSVVTLKQTSALTGGAGTVWAELWAGG